MWQFARNRCSRLVQSQCQCVVESSLKAARWDHEGRVTKHNKLLMLLDRFANLEKRTYIFRITLLFVDQKSTVVRNIFYDDRSHFVGIKAELVTAAKQSFTRCIIVHFLFVVQQTCRNRRQLSI